MRRRWSYSKYSARRYGGRRYSRQRVGPGSRRSAYLKGTSFLCNVYATPSDHLEVKAKGDFDSRFTILQNMLPADPYTLRLNTGLVSFRGDMWRWTRADGKGFFTSESLQYLCNVCSGLGVSSAVVNMRPPMNKWTLTSKMVLGADMTELDKKYYNVNLTTYAGGNNIIQWGQYGQMYDRYFVDYIVFEYVPSCSRMTDGQVTLLWNDNPTDPIPSTMGQFLTNTRCITTQVYNRARLVVRPRRWLWTCPQAGNTGVRSLSVRNQSVTAIPFTDRTVDCGWFAVCARSGKPEYFSAGTIRVSYGIRFSKPSINLEFIRPTTEANADGTTVDGLKPARELIQPAMPAVQRAPPANSLFLSSSNVNARFVQERGLVGRAGDDFMDLDVPQIDGNPQVGSLVMGGGGNPQTVDDQYGSNYVGNPMYYYADTCIGTGGGEGGGDEPEPPEPEPDNPVVPDDPIPPPEPDIPSFAMQSYVKMYGIPFYMGSGFVSPSNASKIQDYLSTYQPPAQNGRSADSYGQNFMGENDGDRFPAGSSGSTPVTPSTVVGFVTMISNDENMSSPKPGQVVSLFGPNCIYKQRDTDSNTRGLFFSDNRLIAFTGTTWNSSRRLNLLTGVTEVQFNGGPNQFQLLGEWDSHASPDSTAGNSVFSGLCHDFMFMFLSKFYAYGVTYYGPSTGRETRTWGVLRELSSQAFDYQSKAIGASIGSSFSFDCFVTSDIPLGSAGASQEPKGNFMPYNQARVWTILSSRPLKLGVHVGIHLSFTRVATPFLLQTWAYLACASGTNGRDTLLTLLGADGASNQSMTWPPVTGVSGNVLVFSSEPNQQILWPFSTYNGLGDQGPKDDLAALTTHGLSYAFSFECDLSGLQGDSSMVFVPSVMFHLGNAEHIGIDVPNYDGYSTDFETENLNVEPPQNVGGYFAAGAQFYINQMMCIVYDPAHVPSGLSDAQLGQYLAANPSAVIMGSGM